MPVITRIIFGRHDLFLCCLKQKQYRLKDANMQRVESQAKVMKKMGRYRSKDTK